MKPSNRSFWIIVFSTGLLFGMLALIQAVPALQAQEISLWRSRWTLALVLFALSLPACGLVLWALAAGRLDGLLLRLDSAAPSVPVRSAAALGGLLALAALWYVRLDLFRAILPQFFPALWVFLWVSLAASLALRVNWRHSWAVSFLVVVLIQAVVFRIWSILGVATDFPFTLEYSETSRFYYGSLWFSRSLYGMDLPLSTLHPSRYFLQAAPYLISSLPLEAHRLWQSLLWILLTGASAWMLARRLKFQNAGIALLVAMWGFVYFLQGAVYYHLQVCVILILWGVSSRQPWRSLVVVILSSLWAGLSRVNWFPVPAMLAVALYLIEEPASTNLWRYLSRPALWTVAGMGVALASQALYIPLSGNGGNVRDFGSSFTSDLIWSRLLPNVTYPMGVLPAVLLVTAPLWIVLVYSLRGSRANWTFIRPMGLFSMVAVLFAGGLVVSTKIGGGADMHNMDAYLMLLAVLAGSFFAGRVVSEKGGWGVMPLWPLALAALIPAAFALQGVGPRMTYDHALAEKDLAALREVVETEAASGGEVLFISERHLITFHMVEGVALVPDYEVVTLMEKAMSGDQTYLEQFYKDLADHRFAVIVTRKQRVVKKTDEPFSEENNVWIDAISGPLLCYYERSLTLESSNTLLLVPSSSQTRQDCP